MRITRLALTAALTLAAAGTALAQGVMAPRNPAGPTAKASLLALPDNPLTPEQTRALNRPRGPQPGIYKLRVLHSGNCVRINFGALLDRQARLTQDSCRTEILPRLEENFDFFAFVPHPAGGYTIRVLHHVRENGRIPVPGQISNCLTVAPGVVIGPARIEARGCEVPNGEGWTAAGNDDQRFEVLQWSEGAWEFRLAASNGENPDCVAARGASRESMSDFIKWGCNGNADQRFMLEWVMALPADLEVATLKRANWHPFADGYKWLSAANGVELLGANASSFETINDKGDYCMKRCAELSTCKAWTWTAPGYAGQAKPMCHWKSEPGRAVNRSRGYYGKVYSGIVRP